MVHAMDLQPIAAYAVVPAPWGPVHLAASTRGVVALEVLVPTSAFVERLERRLRGKVARRGRAQVGGDADRVLAAAMAEVEMFLDARPTTFDLPLDLADRPAWDRAVLAAVREVPWGAVASYGDIARAVGRPGAARAVGGAIGRNPIGLVIPCHRVIAGDGTLGGYGGAWFGTRERLLELKRELLTLEGTQVAPRN